MTKVLVADDERDIRESLVDILFDSGYDVIEAENGRAAVEAAGRELPDIILLDVWMPAMDGFEALAILREDPATSAIPVILLTAMPPIEGEQAGLNLGVEHYISRPWEPGFVESAIEVVLRESRAKLAEGDVGAESEIWQGSAGQRERSNDPTARSFIRTADLLVPLENILGGGLPTGSLTLVEGSSSSGKSVLCQHLTYGALQDDCTVAYFTSDHTARSLSLQMASLGLGISSFLRVEQLQVQPIREPLPNEDHYALIVVLESSIDQLSAQCKMIVLDNITRLAIDARGADLYGFFSFCKGLYGKGKSIIIVAQPHAFDAQPLTRLHSMCNTYLNLRTERRKTKELRLLEVHKVSDVELSTGNTITFEVESGIGIRISSMSSVRV